MYRPFEEGQEIPSLSDIWREHFRGDEPDMADLYTPNAEIPADAAEESTPENLMRRFIDITGALGHLQTVFPEDHPDIMNLRTALHDILDDPEAMSKLESIVGDVGPSKLGTGDPYAIDAFEETEQVFDQQMQSIESAFDEPMFEPAEPYAADIFDEQPEMMFGQLPEEAFPETESLEQIVEQEHVFGAPAPAFMEQDLMPDEMMADMYEDFEGWTLSKLRERVELVQEFDRLCDDIVRTYIEICMNYRITEEEILLPKTIKVLDPVA